MLCINSGTTDISFYTNAFNAIELRRWSNDDGSIHVAELAIDGAMFHLREENTDRGAFSPVKIEGGTAKIGLMVNDVEGVIASAIAAGAIEISPAQDYDYGYRQGEIADPFGHHWVIEKMI